MLPGSSSSWRLAMNSTVRVAGREMDVAKAYAGGVGFAFGGSGDLAVVVEEAPGAQKAADGDVEGAVGDFAVAQGGLKEGEGFGVGGDGVRGGFAVDARELARRLVVAEQIVDAVHLFEGGVEGGLAGWLIRGVKEDRPGGAHGGVVAAVERLGVHGPVAERRAEAEDQGEIGQLHSSLAIAARVLTGTNFRGESRCRTCRPWSWPLRT